jgi:hypothetical protein
LAERSGAAYSAQPALRANKEIERAIRFLLNIGNSPRSPGDQALRTAKPRDLNTALAYNL